MGRTQPFEVAVGVALRQGLRMFQAHGVLLDNYSNQWLREKSSGLFVPPYWAHVSIPLEGVNAAVLEWASPGTIPQPVARAGTIATVIYTEDTVQLSAGSSVPGAPAAPATAVQDTSDATFGAGSQVPLLGPPLGIAIHGAFEETAINYDRLTGHEFGIAPSRHVAADVITYPNLSDTSGTVAAATGVLATVTLAALGGSRWIATQVAARLVQVSGAFAVPEVDLTGLAFGLVWSNWIGVTAVAGNADSFFHSVALLGDVNTNMVFAFSNASAGARQSLALAAYQY